MGDQMGDYTHKPSGDGELRTELGGSPARTAVEHVDLSGRLEELVSPSGRMLPYRLTMWTTSTTIGVTHITPDK